jgi:hypothetical protein
MKNLLIVLLALAAALLAVTAEAQAPRLDAIWARTTADPIVLDGVLDEAAWAAAEVKTITYGEDAGVPGSGFKVEAGWDPIDPTEATLRFLVHENQLYLAAEIADASIGGSREFNRFDGLLMALMDHATDWTPHPPSEYMYTWWYAETTDPQPAGQLPSFWGRWAEWPPGTPRTPDQIAAWDAVTVVDGVSNDDSGVDTGYTIEMRFDLTPMGYDVTQPEGDVIEWNVSIYDTDYFWPINAMQFTANRVWWQGPWGNVSWYNEVRIFARPDVTVSSGPVPDLEPEVVIPNLDVSPAIDGALSEEVWSDPGIYTFDIRWDDAALRETYDGVGPHRSGQYQPAINGNVADILDPADATVKIFHRDHTLYLGFDVRDGVVQYRPEFDRWDGFLITVNDRVERHIDQNLQPYRLSFQVGADGEAVPQDYLLSLVTAGHAQVAIELGSETTVDTLGVQLDNGYTAEVAIDLQSLGYEADLGDGAFFFGICMLDGDSFPGTLDDAGTRTWWYREYEGDCCAPWAHLAPGVVGVAEDDPFSPVAYAVVRNTINPSQRPHIAFSLPEANVVELEVYDLRGRLVERRSLGLRQAGEGQVPLLRQERAAAGVYLYRLQFINPGTGAVRATLQGKTTVVR